jgi:hypothetical protein
MKPSVCLICRRDIAEEERDCCATRHTDGAPVCPACTQLVRSGNRDALDKLYDARSVR